MVNNIKPPYSSKPKPHMESHLSKLSPTTSTTTSIIFVVYSCLGGFSFYYLLLVAFHYVSCFLFFKTLVHVFNMFMFCILLCLFVLCFDDVLFLCTLYCLLSFMLFYLSIMHGSFIWIIFFSLVLAFLILTKMRNIVI